MTNGDKIREMANIGDDGLAELYGVELGCDVCIPLTGGCEHKNNPTTYADCIWNWLDWLKKEAKE